MSYHHAGIADRIFEGDVVVRQRRRDLHQRGQAEQAVAGAVRRDQDAVQVGIFGDPFQLGDAADVAGVGADDATAWPSISSLKFWRR